MFNEINEIIILHVKETEMQKQLKKVIFCFISIIIPFLEFIIIILQYTNMIYSMDRFSRVDFIEILLAVFSIGSLFCTWGMMSVCYYYFKCILTLLIIKTILIVSIIFIGTNSDNFYYYLVFNIIGYGTYYTLIIVYKSFLKGIL